MIVLGICVLGGLSVEILLSDIVYEIVFVNYSF